MTLLLILVLEAYALYGLARLFATPTTEIPRGRVLLVGFAAPLLTGAVTLGVPVLFGSVWPDVALALVVTGCVLLFALLRWCRLGRTPALKATGSFLVLQLLVTVVLLGIFAAA